MVEPEPTDDDLLFPLVQSAQNPVHLLLTSVLGTLAVIGVARILK